MSDVRIGASTRWVVDQGAQLSQASAGPLAGVGTQLGADTGGGGVTLLLSPDDVSALCESNYLHFDVWHDMPYTMELVVAFVEGSRAGQGVPAELEAEAAGLEAEAAGLEAEAAGLQAEAAGLQAEAAGHRVRVSLGIMPGLVTRLCLPLSMLNANTVFLPRTPGRLKAVCSGEPVAAERVTTVWIGHVASDTGQSVILGPLFVSQTEPEYPVPCLPMLDLLGQWTGKDWPNKVRDEGELISRLNASLCDAKSASFPPTWSGYGGDTRRRFDATGYFRTQHDGRRWWLVDPEGCAFFSSGVDCIGPSAECRVVGNERLLEWLPRSDAEAAAFAPAWHGHSRDAFSYSISNAIRAWGGDWFTAWADMTSGRLREWGFNTVANWSDPRFRAGSGLPYVWEPGSFPTTDARVFRDFPDVFSPGYISACERWAEALRPAANDPLMIGYFLRNEPVWAFGENNLAEHLLAAGSALASYPHLLAFLQARYEGSIASLDEAWGASFANWDALEGTGRAGEISDTARRDLWAFTRRLVRQYLEPVCGAARRADPNHLNLGIRWAWISSEACLEGADLFDVFSLNMYKVEPDLETIGRVSESVGKPIIIGEYHWGALDRGLPSTGLTAVADQAQRGVALQRYVELGASSPWLVGAHYFQMNDQPALGRFDGENFQIGLVDVCHQPYRELVEAARRTHERLYDVASGRVAPTDAVPLLAARHGF